MQAPRTFFEFFAGSGMVRIALGDAMALRLCQRSRPGQGGVLSRQPWRRGLPPADVADLRVRDLPGHPALVWASPPCVDISLAGRRAGLNAERSGAFWPFVRLMRELVAEGRSPRVVCIENVPALLSSNGGADFAAIVEAFASLGYMVGAVEIDAALFLPQSRRRLFIICARASDIISAATTQFGPSAPFHTVAILKAHGGLPPPLRVAWAWWRLPTAAVAANRTV